MNEPNEPNEPVPNRLRILAAQENLGSLISVHRPDTWLAPLFKANRIFLYDQGFVACTRKDLLALFRWDEVTVTQRGDAWWVRSPRGGVMRISRRWSDHEEIGRRLPSR
ncbi:MAG TPA: hypothetical protein VL551_23425 [Actinospica sp.]|jgi:hypothetical protein|nr:hypothetical protein [Actinospica sp.]